MYRKIGIHPNHYHRIFSIGAKVRYFSILVVFGLTLLFPNVMALHYTEISWTVDDQSGDDWLVAGGFETADIKILVENTGVEIISATFLIENDLGEFGPLSYSSSDKGPLAKATFKPGTNSGFGNLSVNLEYRQGDWSGSYVFPCHDSTPDGRNDCLIQVDHNTPYEVAFVDYPFDATVNTPANITVGMVDRYGNPIDSAKTAENIRFSCSPSTAYFMGGGQYTTIPVDKAGNATAVLHVSTRAGENIVFVDPVDSRPTDQWITIYGTGEQYPASISASVDKEDNTVYIDSNEPFFTILYTLLDKFGNPSPNAQIDLHTDISEEDQLTIWTNDQGKARVYYGWKSTPGTVALYAETENEELENTLKLYFVLSEGIFMNTDADLIHSLDTEPGSAAKVSATLVGADVTNKMVTFSIEGTMGSYDTGPQLCSDKEFTDCGNSIQKWTNDFGKASIHFRPGTIGGDNLVTATTRVNATYGDYNPGTITIQWQNGIFPEVRTEILPNEGRTCYGPGENISVQLWIVANGTYGPTRPVDLVFAFSRTERMFEDLQRDSMDGTVDDKMVCAIETAVQFVTDLGSNNNRYGLVTFGERDFSALGPTNPRNLVGNDQDDSDEASYARIHYPYFNESGDYWNEPDGGREYSEYATLDLPLSDSIAIEDEGLVLITPSADMKINEFVNPVRFGVYRAIKELVANSTDDNALKAVVFIADDRLYTLYGDPVCGGVWDGDRESGSWSKGPVTGTGSEDFSKNVKWTIFHDIGEDPDWQNLAVWAAEKGVRIYVIGIPEKGKDDFDSQSLENTYRYLAYPTGGNFYYASNYGELEEVFEEIAEELKIAVAQNATMQVDFVEPIPDEMEINKTVKEIFDYIHVGMDESYHGSLSDQSTVIRHWNWSVYDNPDPYDIGAVDGMYIYQNKAIDQSSDWNSGTLHFNDSVMGTINVRETWMTQITLHINETINESMIFNFFGENTAITYSSGEDGDQGYDISIPFGNNVSFCIDPGLFAGPMPDVFIDIYELDYGNFTIDRVPLSWKLNYTGQDAILNEIIEIRNDYGGWNVIGRQTVDSDAKSDTFDWYFLDNPIQDYTVRVTVSSEDAGFDRDYKIIPLSTLNLNPYIKVE